MSSIRVAARVKPLMTLEKIQAKIPVCTVEGNTIRIQSRRQSTFSNVKLQQDQFQFDYCFEKCSTVSKACDQEKVYTAVGSGIVNSIMQGYNACVFAYGQTGSGKTYTMIGDDKHPGIIPRVCQDIFVELLKEDSATVNHSHTVQVSFIEIYQDKLGDLLNPKCLPDMKIRETTSDGPYVEGARWVTVNSCKEILEQLKTGLKKRKVASTNKNDKSSRSHVILTILITQNVIENKELHTRRSKLNLVDLAGSERTGKMFGENEKRHIAEGTRINLSLSNLGQVITALSATASSSGAKQFIPYRLSPLTWLLRESLGGNSRTLMIATVSNCDSDVVETKSTLAYACKARNVVNRPCVNDKNDPIRMEMMEAEISRLNTLLRNMREKIAACDLTNQSKYTTTASTQTNTTVPMKLEHGSQTDAILPYRDTRRIVANQTNVLSLASARMCTSKTLICHGTQTDRDNVDYMPIPPMSSATLQASAQINHKIKNAIQLNTKWFLQQNYEFENSIELDSRDPAELFGGYDQQFSGMYNTDMNWCRIEQLLDYLESKRAEVKSDIRVISEQYEQSTVNITNATAFCKRQLSLLCTRTCDSVQAQLEEMILQAKIYGLHCSLVSHRYNTNRHVDQLRFGKLMIIEKQISVLLAQYGISPAKEVKEVEELQRSNVTNGQLCQEDNYNLQSIVTGEESESQRNNSEFVVIDIEGDGYVNDLQTAEEIQGQDGIGFTQTLASGVNGAYNVCCRAVRNILYADVNRSEIPADIITI